jgi:hypothetical protein
MVQTEPAPGNSARNARGQFLMGHKGGPGRPKGARNKLGEEFLADLQADWARHGTTVLARVREQSPATYLRAFLARRKLAHSSGQTMRRSERILRQRSGIVRSAAFRSSALSLLKNCSIGLRSGEYEGK